MTPQERQEFNMMKETLRNLQRVEDVGFYQNIARRLDIDGQISDAIGNTNINQLADVDTSGVTNGQVLKYNSSNQTWEPADDNIA